MSQRYFLTTPPAGNRAFLEGDEARHVARVMRARTGDSLEVFDGQGRWWTATITEIDRGKVELELGTGSSEPTAAGGRLTLAVALPKGDRQKWLIEKLTELGVDRLVPLQTTRGVAEPTAAAIERLRRGVIEACKQCGRCRLLEITAPGTLQSIVSLAPPARRLLADPAGRPLAAAATPANGDLLVAVGPEGGFTAEEVAAAEAAGFRRVSLGPHILRIETAAIAMAAAYRLT
jgi:16S rRNA (uracil1498-N3)-methyltransferase